MRLFPSPHEGIHPAFPKHLPPRSVSPAIFAADLGGQAGLVATALGAFFSSRPEIGLTVAAWTTLGGTAFRLYDSHWQAKTAAKYLAIQGIEIPRRRLVERVFDLDCDNFIVAGGLIGVLVAIRRPQPWSIGGFSRLMGAYTFGSFAANRVVPFSFMPGMQASEPAEQIQKHKLGEHIDDVARKLGLSPFQSMRLHFGLPSALKVISMSYGPTFEGVQGIGIDEDGEPQMMGSISHLSAEYLDDDVDKVDPQPHKTITTEDGKRIPVPQTNHLWRPGKDGLKVLHEHLADLEAERRPLALETEKAWHIKSGLAETMLPGGTVKAKHPEMFPPPADIPLPPAAEQGHRELIGDCINVIGDIHHTLWSKVSDLDWLIADTKRLITLLQHHEKGELWAPPLSNAARDIEPRNITALLDSDLQELEQINAVLALQEPRLKARAEELRRALPEEVLRAKWGAKPGRKELDEIEMILDHCTDTRFMVDVVRTLKEFVQGGDLDSTLKLNRDGGPGRPTRPK